MLLSNVYALGYTNVLDASLNIEKRVVKTPLVKSKIEVSNNNNTDLFFKMENLQNSGSFKLRGAWNKYMDALSNGSRPNCLVCASTGNQGLAVSMLARSVGLESIVIMPKFSSPSKQQRIQALKAKLEWFDGSVDDMHEMIKVACCENPRSLFFSSQDPTLIAGQGTVAVEILEQRPDVDAILVPVGSGSLISGIAIYVKTKNPNVRIYGVESEASKSCYMSKKNGRLTMYDHLPNSVADGIRSNIGRNTWPIIRDFVDDVILVSEEEIIHACDAYHEIHESRIEPSSAAVVAAFRSPKIHQAIGWDENVKCVVGVLTGGNVLPEC